MSAKTEKAQAIKDVEYGYRVWCEAVKQGDTDAINTAIGWIAQGMGVIWWLKIKSAPIMFRIWRVSVMISECSTPRPEGATQQRQPNATMSCGDNKARHQVRL